ncbi:hypothetical protein Ancab_000480 [Ancistrocladus abbreviatus]
MSRQAKGNLAIGFRTCSQETRGSLMSHGLRKQGIHLKVKRRIPKKIQKAMAKTRSACKEKEAVLCPARRKDDLLGSGRHEILPVAASRDDFGLRDVVTSPQMQQRKRNKRCDSVCFICQYGDNLLPCDHCSSSYHLSCIDLKVEDGFAPLVHMAYVAREILPVIIYLLNIVTNAAVNLLTCRSKFRRLDFHGLYCMILLNNEELVCAATVRIHGQKVAEMPLVVTPFKYRQQGMCRLLVHELEKILIGMGVEKLVLPAISQLKETWVSSFGFTKVSAPQRQELVAYPFLVFQGTSLFQKVLSKSNLVNYSSHASKRPQMTAAGVSQNHWFQRMAVDKL